MTMDLCRLFFSVTNFYFFFKYIYCELFILLTYYLLSDNFIRIEKVNFYMNYEI